MANTNTKSALYSLPANFGATETAVALRGSTTTRALLSVSNDVAGGLFDGHPFRVRVVAQGVASGAGNFVVNLYWNSAANTGLTTFTSDILIIGSGNQALASKSGVVYMEAVCMWDSTSQQLAAFWNEAAGAANIPTTPAIIKTTAAVTATSPVTTALTNTSSLSFFVTTAISANGTAATLIEAAIEQI